MTTKLTPKKLIGDFITLKQLVQSVPVSERTIRNWIDAGKMRAYKLDGKLVFNVLDIEAFLQRRRVGGGSIAPIVKPVSQEQVRMLSDEEIPAYLRPTPVPSIIPGMIATPGPVPEWAKEETEKALQRVIQRFKKSR
jgi:excisionase family DNA binding protein